MIYVRESEYDLLDFDILWNNLGEIPSLSLFVKFYDLMFNGATSLDYHCTIVAYLILQIKLHSQANSRIMVWFVSARLNSINIRF